MAPKQSRRLSAKTPPPQSPAVAVATAAEFPSQEEPTTVVAAEPATAVVAADGPGAASILEAVLRGALPQVKRAARAWAELCRADARAAALEALNALLELSSLPGMLRQRHLEEDPGPFLARLPQVAKEMGLDLATYPLLPSVKYGKRAAFNLDRFWSLGIGDQNAGSLLESGLMNLLERWFLAMSQVAIRPLRHIATIAALATAGALGQQHQSLRRSHDTAKRQLEAAARRRSAAKQLAQTKRDVARAESQVKEVHNIRTHLLETIVPARSRDVSEVIRLYTLCETDRLMAQDPDLFKQGKWTARVFLMIHDPVVEVRLKAVEIFHQWYESTWKLEPMREHLASFAQRSLTHLVERIGDVDIRVAIAAVRCVRLPALAERLNDGEFDQIVNLCIGSRHLAVRQEAALFINDHVFEEPGIVAQASGAEEVETDAKWASEKSLSMLVEYLRNYMGDQLRLTERLVGAFWGKAPVLTRWATMVNLCLVGDMQPGLAPVQPGERLALLYVMEAAVRRCSEDWRGGAGEEREAAAAKLNEACTHVLPEMPRLLDVCRPEEEQSLLLSHLCKLLLEYAVETGQSQVLVHASATCAGLRRHVEEHAPFDTAKYCVDSILALAGHLAEAKTAFLDISKAVHQASKQLLSQLRSGASLTTLAEELRSTVSLFVLLSNRGMDLTFGRVDILEGFLDLLRCRAQAGAPEGAPAEFPDARLTLALLEAAVTSVMWFVRMASWGRDPAESALLESVAVSQELLADLPRVIAKLRQACVDLIAADRSHYVKFHAYSTYMGLLQLALGVSDKVSLDEKGADSKPSSWAGTHEVRFPEEHMKVIWQYLNTFYTSLQQADVEGLTFSDEGYRVRADVQPAPFLNMTSVRFLTLHCLQSPAEVAEGAGLTQQNELLLAVLASKSVMESEVEAVYAGPLGLLLLTQCDRRIPKPLRDVAVGLLRRLRSEARISQDFASQLYTMQREAVTGLFDCCNLERAASLSAAFIKLAGPRVLPQLEQALFNVLRSAVADCVSEDRRRLPLLEVFAGWFKSGFEEAHSQEIVRELLSKCRSCGIDGNVDPHVAKFLQRVQHPAVDAAVLQDEPAAAAAEEREQGAMEEQLDAVPGDARTGGKRSLEEAKEEVASPKGTPFRKRLRTSDSVATLEC